MIIFNEVLNNKFPITNPVVPSSVLAPATDTGFQHPFIHTHTHMQVACTHIHNVTHLIHAYAFIPCFSIKSTRWLENVEHTRSSYPSLSICPHPPDWARETAEISLTVLRATQCLSLRLAGSLPPSNSHSSQPRGSYSTSKATFSQGKFAAMEKTGITRQS